MNAQIELSKSQPLQIFGQDEQIAGLVRRLRFMIPGAAEAPDMVVWKAAQIAHMHQLDPFSGDIYIYPKKGTYIVDTGVAAWRRAAQRQARYTTTKRLLSNEEVRLYNAAEYKPTTVGVECTLYRLDVARECKELGIPYSPVITRGFWKDGDTIPNTETAVSVAERRAEKKALRVAFSLDFPDDMRIDNGSQTVQITEVERIVKSEERNRLPVQAKASAEELVEFMNGFVDPQPAADDDLLTDAEFKELESLPPGPKLSEKEKLLAEINALGKKAANWEARKVDAIAKASNGSAESINELSVAQLEWIADILRKETATGK